VSTPDRIAAKFLGILAFVFGASAPGIAETNGWAAMDTPSFGPARVHGYYANGCIAGARALPKRGRGFVVLRPQRNRYWGHPSLVAFVQDFARQVAERGQLLLIADLGQPRGGPVSGHASHQAGLDADIRLKVLPHDRATKRYLAKPPYVSMLTKTRRTIDRRRWSPRQTQLIRTAARDPRVDRIFVHPVIKRELCRTTNGNRSWLAKVVPWYGHHAHMHVRLRCPTDSPGCKRQRTLPRGDGCGKALAWWIARLRGKRPTRPARPSRPVKPRPRKVMPQACRTVLAR